MDLSRYCASTSTIIERLRMRYCIASCFLIGNVHRFYVRTRIVTKQVMVPESSRWNFVIVKNQVTMNAIVSLEDIIADIHSCVTSRRSPVEMQIRHHCRIWMWRLGVWEELNILLLEDEIGWFELYIVVKLGNNCICPTWTSIYCHMMSPIYIMIL